MEPAAKGVPALSVGLVEIDHRRVSRGSPVVLGGFATRRASGILVKRRAKAICAPARACTGGYQNPLRESQASDTLLGGFGHGRAVTAAPWPKTG